MLKKTTKLLLHKQMVNMNKSFSALIDASKTMVTMNKNLKEKLPVEKLEFGKTFTDHMLTIDWDKEKYVETCMLMYIIHT
jgi:hypothetical protein